MIFWKNRLKTVDISEKKCYTVSSLNDTLLKSGLVVRS